MGFINNQINLNNLKFGSVAKNRNFAINWFKTALKSRDNSTVKKTRQRLIVGKIYVFRYDKPKYKDTLKWWDRNPVVLALEQDYSKTYDVGINLNLLPIKYRIAILDIVYDRYEFMIKNAIKGAKSNNADTQKPISNLKYNEIKKLLDKVGFGFAIRRYLPNLKENQSVVAYECWPLIAICEFAQLNGSCTQKIKLEFMNYNKNKLNIKKTNKVFKKIFTKKNKS